MMSLHETEAIHKQVNAEERERAREKRQAKAQ